MIKLFLGLLALIVIVVVTGYTPSLKKSGTFIGMGIVFILVGALLGHLFGRSALDVVLLQDRSYLMLVTPAIGYLFIILGLIGIFKSMIDRVRRSHRIDRARHDVH